MKITKKKTASKMSYGQRLIGSLKEAVAIERGEAAPASVSTQVVTARTSTASPAPLYGANDVKKIRTSVKLSQAVFAATLNVSPDTVRAWEQGKKQPGGPAARLLELTEKNPGWVLTAVHERMPKRNDR
ncbi:MAG: helix-turn-helix domain-containing protein [Gemmatimonadaceae bacterium]|nr:helix-turn-helix domain-containing protein [Gemmatimonadaceae bacterium]